MSLPLFLFRLLNVIAAPADGYRTHCWPAPQLFLSAHSHVSPPSHTEPVPSFAVAAPAAQSAGALAAGFDGSDAQYES